MAKIESREPISRGQKRLRPENQGTPSGTPAPESSRKRPRLDDGSKTIVGRIKKAFFGFVGYFWGKPRDSDDGDVMSEADNSVDNDDISIISETLNSSGRHMETIQASEPSTLDMVAGTDKDEVQLVKVVNSAKSFRQSGQSSLGRFYGGAYSISTKEKRDKEREDRKSINVQSQLRKGALPFKSALATFPTASWKADKPTFKRRTLSRDRGIYESYKLEELAKYKNVYEKVLLCPDSSIATLTNSFNRTPRRGLNHVADSPFFPRKTTITTFAGGAITKVQLSDERSRLLSRGIQSKSERSRERRRLSEHPLILLDHDDDDEVVALSKPRPSGPDADVIEILDAYSPTSPRSPKQKSTAKKNSLESELLVHEVCHGDFLKDLMNKYDTRTKTNEEMIRKGKIENEFNKEITQRLEKNLEDRMRKHLTITEVTIEEPEEEEEVLALPEISPEMAKVINNAMSSGGQVLVDAYSIPISRKDLETLRGLNWLNDEIINFYMQMIVGRSKKTDNWPTVYACNTFFYPKLLDTGFATLKRWTRKVDLFAHDLILIPVHLGMHWCLAVVNFKKKGIYYYDSMGGNNDRCLQAIEKYLQDEHMDKKKTTLDTSNFEKVNVKDIPKQMNGSDCGMFACKFAEYLSRNAAISFTQDDMPYFRRRMIYEIVKNTLLHP